MSKVVMNDGAGGELMQEFISKHITSHFPKMDTEVPLDALDDSAVVDDVVFTIDGHTVNPLSTKPGTVTVLISLWAFLCFLPHSIPVPAPGL